MINADSGGELSRFARRVNDRHVGEAEAMVLIVISEESERWIAVLNLCLEDSLVSLDHFIKVSGHIKDVGELRGYDHIVGAPFRVGAMKAR
jgi:hypothetical protein